MAELKLKLTVDKEDLKRQLNALNIPLKVDGAGGGGKSEKLLEEQTTGIEEISAGVAIGNAVLASINVILSALDPILRPIFSLIKILVLLIFLPLLPLMKPVFKFLAEFLKFFAKTLSSKEGQVVAPAIPLLAVIGGAIGGLLGSAFGPGGTAIGIITGVFVGGILGMLAIVTGQVLSEIVKFLSELDWGVIIKTFSDMLTGAIDIASTIITGILGFLAELDWDSILDALVNGFANILGTGKTLIENLFNALPEPLKTAWNTIVDAIKEVDKLLFGPEGVWLKIITALKDTEIKLIDAWNKIIDSLGQILRDIEPFVNFLAGKGFTRAPEPREPTFRERVSSFFESEQSLTRKTTDPIPFMKDFISRPGQAPVPFSPSDTIVGFKGNGGGLGGGVNYSPVFNISADVDGNSLKKALEEHDRQFLTRLRAFGTLGGRSLNV